MDLKKKILSPEAQQDLIDIWAYIAQFSEDAADTLIDLIDLKTDLLTQVPHTGKQREEIYPNLRSFPVKKYIIFYRPIDDGIEIVRVLHGARDIDNLL